jgi:hypothetical protein
VNVSSAQRIRFHHFLPAFAALQQLWRGKLEIFKNPAWLAEAFQAKAA